MRIKVTGGGEEQEVIVRRDGEAVSDFIRRKHGEDFYRRIGNAGAKAVLKKYGKSHMAKIGSIGGKNTTQRTFRDKSIASKAGKKAWANISPEERSDIMSERGKSGIEKRWGKRK